MEIPDGLVAKKLTSHLGQILIDFEYTVTLLLQPPLGDGSEDYVEHLWTLLYELKPTLFITLNKLTIIEDQEVSVAMVTMAKYFLNLVTRCTV